MPITTLDGAAAGAIALAPLLKATTGNTTIGRPVSLWGLAGVPGAGSFSSTLAGATLSSADAGALWRGNPASGNSYVSVISAIAAGNSAASGCLMLIDRLWHNGGFTITSTTAQTVSSVTWPSRCPTSATDQTPATTGYGVLLGLEVSATTGAGTPTITVGYTNAAGTASRTATNLVATGASSPNQSFYPIGLQAGDTGVRSVQSVTLSATWTSGTMNLVAYRILGVMPLSQSGLPLGDFLNFGAPRVYDGSCLSFLFIPNSANPVSVYATLVETQG